MPGPPVTIGADVILVPGATILPDLGKIQSILPPFITANGNLLATSGSICEMINTLTGIHYPLIIGTPASGGVTVGGKTLVRMFDRIPTYPGILTILGPPAVPFIIDQWPP